LHDISEQDILNTSLKIIEERGFDAFSMRKLAVALKVSTMTLYSRFSNKQEILVRLVLMSEEELEKRFLSVQAGDIPSRLAAYSVAYRSFFIERPVFYMLTYASGIAVGDASINTGKREGGAYRLLLNTVREGIDGGVLKPGDPLAVSDLLWSAVHGFLALEFSGFFPGQDNSEKFAQVLRGLATGIASIDPGNPGF
jgi:AcrR family transcriptional regulator